MIDIAERMTELIEVLHRGINGIEFPDAVPANRDWWSPDYAYIEDLEPDTFMVESDYFDRGRLMEDFRELVRDHFAGDDTITISFNDTTDLEVCREDATLCADCF